jgi:predicted phosphohydrolase
MKRVAWLTDLHLNFVTPGDIDRLCGAVREAGADAVLLGGDIGEAHDVVEHLEGLDARLGLPVYFVLGNHDFYRGSIAGVRAAVRALSARSPRLHWLQASGVIALTQETALVGHDGWADGRYGDYEHSEVLLNDYLLIEELAGLDAEDRLRRLHALGDEAAAHFRAVLPDTLARFPRLIVLTHVPPFREACWHRGRISDDDWLPHFACRAVGEVLGEAMAAHPECEMTVLCGHTHSAGEAQILPNLRVLTGGAEYGQPEVQRVLYVP